MKVFISYKHEDDEQVSGLITDFVNDFSANYVNEDSDFFTFYDKYDISAGSNWLNTIKGGLKDSNVFLFIITKNFFNSEFITDTEIPAALIKASESKEILLLYFYLNEKVSNDFFVKNNLQSLNSLNPYFGLTENEAAKRKIIEKLRLDIVEQIFKFLMKTTKSKSLEYNTRLAKEYDEIKLNNKKATQLNEFIEKLPMCGREELRDEFESILTEIESSAANAQNASIYLYTYKAQKPEVFFKRVNIDKDIVKKIENKIFHCKLPEDIRRQNRSGNFIHMTIDEKMKIEISKQQIKKDAEEILCNLNPDTTGKYKKIIIPIILAIEGNEKNAFEIIEWLQSGVFMTEIEENANYNRGKYNYCFYISIVYADALKESAAAIVSNINSKITEYSHSNANTIFINGEITALSKNEINEWILNYTNMSNVVYNIPYTNNSISVQDFQDTIINNISQLNTGNP